MGLSIKMPKIDEIKNKLNYNKISIAIALLIFIIGFGFACSAIYYVVFDINRNKNAIRTQATVQKVEFVNDNYLLNIEYEVDTIENSMYHLAVVKGNNKGKPCYAINFTSVNAGEYFCVLKAENTKYLLPTDNRKDSMALAIESEVAMVIEIYNKEGRLQAVEKDLPIFTIKDM